MAEQEGDGYTYTAGYESRSAEGGVLVVDDLSSEDIVKQLAHRVDIVTNELSKILVKLEDLKKENYDQNVNVEAQLSGIETRLTERLTDFTQQASMLQKKESKKLEGLSGNIDQESRKLEALSGNIDQESRKLEALSGKIDQESANLENTLEIVYKKMDEISDQLQMVHITSHAYQHRAHITALSEKVIELHSRLSVLEGKSESSNYMPLEQHDDEIDVANEDHHDAIIMND